MINWAEQSEQLFNSWQTSQKALWDNWLNIKPYDYTKSEEMWQAMLETWQNSVEQTLVTQKESMELWFAKANEFEGTPEEFKALLKQAEDMNLQWQKTQTDTWTTWFNLVRDVDVAGMTTPFKEATDEALKTTQNTVRQMMDLQASLLKSFTGETK